MFFLLISCAQKHEGEIETGLLSNFISITDNEDKGIKEVLAFFGGYCEYSVGFTSSTIEGSKQYFELKLSQCKTLDKYKKTAELPASHMAYLFYKNLNDEEKKNYAEIHSVLIFNNGVEKTYKFPTSDLDLVIEKMPIVHKIVEIIKQKDFISILPILNDSTLHNYDKNQLVTNLGIADTTFGNVTEEGFKPFGFKFAKSKGGKGYLHISGMIMRDKLNNEFSLDLDLDTSNHDIYLIDYQY